MYRLSTYIVIKSFYVLFTDCFIAKRFPQSFPHSKSADFLDYQENRYFFMRERGIEYKMLFYASINHILYSYPW